jgi:hypothetical protein
MNARFAAFRGPITSWTPGRPGHPESAATRTLNTSLEKYSGYVLQSNKHIQFNACNESNVHFIQLQLAYVKLRNNKIIVVMCYLSCYDDKFSQNICKAARW